VLPSNTATNTPTTTATPLSTNTLVLPTATPTATPQPPYQVRPGDTLSGIATAFGVSVDAIMAANNLSGQDAYTLRPGEFLTIPTLGATETQTDATATINRPTTPPTATPPPRTYTIRSGDTPIAIANQFGVSVDALMAANGLTLEDARRLRTGQVLVIPGAGQSSVTPSRSGNPVAPATGQVAIRLDAPQLISPESGAQVSCNATSSLAWRPVNFLRASDLYLLHMGFVNTVGADGQESITWVLEQVQPSTNTLWPMDSSLCSLAPQQFGRKWYWYVEVIEQTAGGRVRVSAPSASWAFYWN
jgi:LysM repeat protein